MPPREIYFITGNSNKLAEVEAILGDIVPLKSRSLDLIEIQGTMEDISKDKCRRAADMAIGHEGLNNLLAAYEDKSAEAVCTLAYCEGPGHEPLIFEGRVQGKIVPARGPPNFGWDPIFEYMGETYAKMDKAKKNELSHRCLALAKLKDWLRSHW
ncbi:MAG: hypothetical protein Q9166_007381 [cf. Caloplaca sp. 2 TL-2023]